MNVLSAAICLSVSAFHLAQEAPRYAGATEKGFLLPNGWTLKPAGDHVVLKDLPLNIIPLPDSKFALAATSGYNAHELTLIDLEARKVIDHKTVGQSWFGLALCPHSDRVWWSGGGGNEIHAFRLKDRHLTRALGPESTPKPKASAKTSRFRGGLAVDTKRNWIYSLDVDRGTISALDLETHKELKSRRPARGPMTSSWHATACTCLFPIGQGAWCAYSIRAICTQSRRIAVGEHPTQIAVHPGDDRIFVACALSNYVSIIDTRRGIVTETISTALFPQAPEGSTPDAVGRRARRQNAVCRQRRQQ